MGVLAAVISYIMWGISTIFWKQLSHVSAQIILTQRVIWSLIFVLIIIFFQKGFKGFLNNFKDKKTVGLHLLSGILLAANWLTFVFAVNNGYIVDASLGYFINPLVSILLGLILLKEKARPIQIVAISTAALGVIFLTISEGKLPWISLLLAFSFGFYGYLRKKSPLESVNGIAMETTFLFVPAVLFSINQFDILYFSNDLLSIFYLIGTGIITATPLILFAYAARKITLMTVGILQYLAPILQFSVGTILYKEALSQSRLITFIFVWIALIIYTFEAISTYRIRKKSNLSAIKSL